ncbi:MAG: hypothetical protein PUE59_03805 [Treponema sp.]|nr:hypothetical protein [Spirochaetia bacterium]MDD5776368.1 hypothetical protein [Treponema sp.]MDD6654127.1 hypothetical protein [Treponema sp.]MDY4152780.1 hypothetical protein [Treponema sp.]
MTDEQKKNLFLQIDGLLEIYKNFMPIDNFNFSIEKLKSTYTEMIQFIIDDVSERENLLAFLAETDFYKAPASTRFHGDFESGLSVHTMQVIYQALKFAKPLLSDFFISKRQDDFNVSAKDIFVSALSHDFCKVGFYEVSFRNTKDVFGNWVKKSFYKTKDDLRNLGHGNESVLILLKLMPSMIDNRTVLEAVSRHMGFTDLTDSEKMNYSNFLQNPLVLLLQLADQSASSWYDY